MQAWLDNVRDNSQQLYHYYSHGIHVADCCPGSIPLRRRMSSCTQCGSATRKSVTGVASLSRARLAVALVICASVILCSPNYVLYGPVSLDDQPGFWIDYNELVVPAHRVSVDISKTRC